MDAGLHHPGKKPGFYMKASSGGKSWQTTGSVGWQRVQTHFSTEVHDAPVLVPALLSLGSSTGSLCLVWGPPSCLLVAAIRLPLPLSGEGSWASSLSPCKTFWSPSSALTLEPGCWRAAHPPGARCQLWPWTAQCQDVPLVPQPPHASCCCRTGAPRQENAKDLTPGVA